VQFRGQKCFSWTISLYVDRGYLGELEAYNAKEIYAHYYPSWLLSSGSFFVTVIGELEKSLFLSMSTFFFNSGWKFDKKQKECKCEQVKFFKR